VSVVATNGGPGFSAGGLNSVGTNGSTGDAAFDNVVNSLTYSRGTPSGITAATMSFGGLESGKEYKVQVFFSDQRTAGTIQNRAMIFGDGSGHTVMVAGNDGSAGGAGEFGQFAVGTFTADAATQTLTMRTSGFGNVHFNAILLALADPGPPPAPETPSGLVARPANHGVSLDWDDNTQFGFSQLAGPSPSPRPREERASLTSHMKLTELQMCFMTMRATINSTIPA